MKSEQALHDHKESPSVWAKVARGGEIMAQGVCVGRTIFSAFNKHMHAAVTHWLRDPRESQI